MRDEEYLKPGDVITLGRRNQPEIKMTWNIKNKVGEGANAQCYKATCNGAVGHLKRLKYDQLFIDAYESLQNIKLSNKDNEILNNYIPYMELYDDGDNLYCWTPEDASGVTLSDYYQTIKSNKNGLESKLYKLIGLMITIVKGTMLLHEAGMLHLDIKPSNFLVPFDLAREINEHAISMYDIDSFLLMGETSRDYTTGTKGFVAPEVERGHADIRSDIYSIGATLYNGLVWDDSNKYYSREKYDFIDEQVINSPLIKDSEFCQNEYLIYYLQEILKKCLAFSKNRRYSCCDELLEELEEARKCMVDVINRKYVSPERKLVFEAQDKSINPIAVIQNALYERPLYDYADSNKNINVLVVGLGECARSIMDICLQSAQMPGYTINIKNLSNKGGFACKVYKELRPGMCDFVKVNGEFHRKDQTPYGSIEFKDIPILAKISGDVRDNDNSRAIDYIVDNHIAGAGVSYIFVAAGNDEVNRGIATGIEKRIMENSDCRCVNEKGNVFIPPILYVDQESGKVLSDAEKNAESSITPLYVNRDYETIINPDLERQAFNVHLKWMYDKSADYYKAREEFRDKYNHDASVAYALSIKYKLHLLGLNEDLDNGKSQPEEIVKNYDFIKKTLENNHELVHAEHRRWVLEKLCNGWTGFEKLFGKTDYNNCIKRGSVKYAEDRRHPCIVFDSPTEYLSQYTPKMWDNPGEYDEKLDELDMMSLDLHRAFRARTIAICEKGLGSVERLKGYSGKNNSVASIAKVYSDMCKTAKDIVADAQLLMESSDKDNAEDVKQYRAKIKKAGEIFDQLYADAFANADEIVRSTLSALKKDMFAIRQFSYYIDYKSYDKDLIVEIPFILNNNPIPYTPSPIDTSGVELSEEMLKLVDKLATHSHDVWALGRIDEGWEYGHERNDAKKTHPDLMPFDRLPETEKEYDRATAREIIKALVKLGYLT